MALGFTHLVATTDWYRRLVVSWRLSNSLAGSFRQATRESLTRGKPAIINTDQGVQFTSSAWTRRLESAGVKVSMGGVGRCYDNTVVERLWQSVKYEELYPKRYATVPELAAGLTAYFRRYNVDGVHHTGQRAEVGGRRDLAPLAPPTHLREVCVGLRLDDGGVGRVGKRLALCEQRGESSHDL